MRIAVIGSNGQLGRDLVRAFGSQSHDVIAWTRQDFDIRDHERLSKAILATHPDAVINAAVFHPADACEVNIDLSFAVNATAVAHMAQACQESGAALVHVSTNYVFDGEKGTPYTEEDCPRPINVYGISKLAGECFVAALCRSHYVVRVASLFGTSGASTGRGNFVETMLGKAAKGESISVVDDVVMSPTFAVDAAVAIRRLVEERVPFGVYHVTNAGICAWYDFARTIFEMSGIRARLSPWTITEAAPKARRPTNSALSCRKFETSTLTFLRPWRDALGDYLGARGRSRHL